MAKNVREIGTGDVLSLPKFNSSFRGREIEVPILFK